MNDEDEVVKPDSAPESTPEAIQEDEQAPPESSAREDAAAKDSSAAGSKSAKVDPKAERERLISELTTGKKGDDDEDAEEDDSEAETADESEAAGPEKPEAAAEPAAEKVPENEEDALDAPLPRGTKEETAARYAKLNAARKEMKPFADYGRGMFEFMKTSNLDPQDVGFLLDLGARLKADPVKGAEHAYSYAKAVAEKHGAKLPIETKIERQVPDELLIALDDIITDSIVESGITPEVAKKIRAEVRKHKVAAAAQPSPSPTQSQPSVQNQPAPTPIQQPVHPAMDPRAVHAAGAELAQVQAEYAKAMPADWAKLKPQVDKAMEKYAGTQPHQWAGFYRTEVELAKAKAIKARPPTPPKAIRPSAASTPSQNNPRSDAVGFLTGRKT